MSSTSAPAAKRKREDEGASVAIKRSELWLDDGNVVLQAEDTQFKVHRSILSLNSTVFRDMFSTSQPVGEPLIEGCPSVFLSDTAADVTVMLEAFCRRRYVAAGAALPVAVVAAFLRLGNKYDIEVLRDEALKRLFYELPTNFHSLTKLNSFSMIENVVWWELDLVNIAREQGLHSALPMAMYCCCNIWHQDEVPGGILRDDGTRCLLSPEDERTCLMAYIPLMKLQGETTYAWLTHPGSKYPECKTPSKCISRRKTLAIEMFFPLAEIIGLNAWNRAWETHMCSVCVKIAKTEHENGRRLCWEALPAIFGFPEWEELNEERDQIVRYVRIAPEDRGHDR